MPWVSSAGVFLSIFVMFPFGFEVLFLCFLSQNLQRLLPLFFFPCWMLSWIFLKNNLGWRKTWLRVTSTFHMLDVSDNSFQMVPVSQWFITILRWTTVQGFKISLWQAGESNLPDCVLGAASSSQSCTRRWVPLDAKQTGAKQTGDSQKGPWGRLVRPSKVSAGSRSKILWELVRWFSGYRHLRP